MNESILTSIKKRLGIPELVTDFDEDVIMDINAVLSILRQIGIGPTEAYSITGSSETWSDYVSDTSTIQLVKTYIYLKVRLMFDPPQSSVLTDAINQNIKELESRLNYESDFGF